MTSIVVRGIPAPQGSKRHVGGGRMVESSKAVGPWREAVRAECQRAGVEPLDGDVMVIMSFRLPRPKGHYGTGRNWQTVRPSAAARPSGKPDLDKLIRAVFDGLTAGGAWRDDSQAVGVMASKWFAELNGALPGLSIKIERAEG